MLPTPFNAQDRKVRIDAAILEATGRLSHTTG